VISPRFMRTAAAGVLVPCLFFFALGVYQGSTARAAWFGALSGVCVLLVVTYSARRKGR
jgi:hypothetical protein